MSVGVGLPIIGLSRSGSHKSGKMRGVLYEAWEPRAGKDPDIDRGKTPGNIYDGPRSAEEIARLMDTRVASFSAARQRAGGRALKSDAQFGAAMIIKPEKAWINGLSDAEKLRFFEDARMVTCELLGVQPLSSVIHVDEQAWHMHLAFLAELPDGTINYDAVFGLKGKKRLNAGFAALMRERGGWDITPAELYDADRARDDPEYKARMTKKRKEHNQNSAKYKAQRDADRAAEELRRAEEARRAAEASKGVAEAVRRASEGMLSEARVEAVQIKRKAVEDAQRAAEVQAREIMAEAEKARQEASEALQEAKHERAVARVSARTADWERAEAQKLLETARITPAERKLLDAAKRTRLKGGESMYDYLERQVRTDSISAPQSQAQQPQRGRDY